MVRYAKTTGPRPPETEEAVNKIMQTFPGSRVVSEKDLTRRLSIEDIPDDEDPLWQEFLRALNDNT